MLSAIASHQAQWAIRSQRLVVTVISGWWLLGNIELAHRQFRIVAIARSE
jgi:hypothetical protein